MSTDLINGKNKISRIVSIGTKKSKAILFIETPEGKIEETEWKLQHWLLSDKIHDNNWFSLNGNLHYKYARFFTSLQEMLQYKSNRPNADFFEIYDDKERLMIKEGICYYRDMKPEDVSILSFDIETTTLEHNEKSQLLLISNTYRNKGKIERKLFAYDEYNDEGEMISEWCKWVREKNPSIICNHNINAFDFPYIKFIADKYEVPLNLGRDGSEVKFNKKESKFRKDGSQFYHYHKISIFGREVVDTLFLSIKYDVGRKYENYRLKNIIRQEGLEIKERVFYDADKIRFNYEIETEWAKIKEYAIHDADDALALYDLMIPPIFYSAQIIPRPLQQLTETAEGGKINAIMLRAYLQQKHSVPKASPPIKYEGAISHGVPGIHSNVLSFDVASLYPSIMIEYQVYNKEKDPKGYFLELVKTLTEERLKHKKLAKETGNKYYTHLEQSEKVTINSCYGFLGAAGLNFNSPDLAAFITEKGREILKIAIKWATGKEYEDWKKDNNL
jgi:DNA polymerase elongation subunit (family B)